MEVRSGEWLTELLRQCAHPGGAAVCGAMLFYPDETIQHAGVITGLGGYAGHSHKYKKAGGSGYLFLMLLAAMLALACFNIWRKVRRKTRNQY